MDKILKFIQFAEMYAITLACDIMYLPCMWLCSRIYMYSVIPEVVGRIILQNLSEKIPIATVANKIY